MGAAKSRFTKPKHKDVSHDEISPKVVLFAGSSHKLGLALALSLAEDPHTRFKALVTMPSLEGGDYLADSRVLSQLNKTLFVLQMDVNSEDSIREVISSILDNDGILDAVVITSNVMLTGPLETHTIEQARILFDTNTYSVMRIVQCVLPVMKKQRDGNIIVLSNQAGILGMPFHGIYCATRFAIEGFLESLAPEGLTFNVFFSILETTLLKGEEKTAQTLQVSIRSKMGLTDDSTRKIQESFSTKMKRQGSVKKINHRRVSDSIRDVLLADRPHFRYQLNRASKEAAREKWHDVHGDDYVSQAAEKYLCVETERLQAELNHITEDAESQAQSS